MSGRRAGSKQSELSDRLNPIVVKELRQAVQSRFVSAALMTLLTIQLAAIGIYLLSSGESLLDFTSGRNVFVMLFAILQGVSMLFVPLYTAARLAAERSDTNVDLLFITTLKPRSIITGKMAAAGVLAVLVYSACMPFITFTYFLRGIDLPAIFLSLGFGFFVVLVCTQLAVVVACMPINRAFKVILGILTFLLFAIAYTLTMTWAGRLAWGGFRGDRGDFWRGFVFVTGSVAFLTGLLFSIAVALIQPLAANRARAVRLYITVGWALLGAAAMIASAIQGRHSPVTMWNVLFCSVFAISFFAAVSERDSYGRRMLRAVPSSPIRRLPAFLFSSGGANGVAWAVVMIVLTLAAVWLWAKSAPTRPLVGDLVESAKWMGGTSLYLFCYALSAALLQRILLRRLPRKFTWLLGLILLALGGTLPIITGYLLFFSDRWMATDFSFWFVGNPFAWDYKQHRVFFASVAGAWAALAATLNAPWFLSRWNQFRPFTNRNPDQAGESRQGNEEFRLET
jgi:hypothetical protein